MQRSPLRIWGRAAFDVDGAGPTDTDSFAGPTNSMSDSVYMSVSAMTASVDDDYVCEEFRVAKDDEKAKLDAEAGRDRKAHRRGARHESRKDEPRGGETSRSARLAMTIVQSVRSRMSTCPEPLDPRSGPGGSDVDAELVDTGLRAQRVAKPMAVVPSTDSWKNLEDRVPVRSTRRKISWETTWPWSATSADMASRRRAGGHARHAWAAFRDEGPASNMGDR